MAKKRKAELKNMERNSPKHPLTVAKAEIWKQVRILDLLDVIILMVIGVYKISV